MNDSCMNDSFPTVLIIACAWATKKREREGEIEREKGEKEGGGIRGIMARRGPGSGRTLVRLLVRNAGIRISVRMMSVRTSVLGPHAGRVLGVGVEVVVAAQALGQVDMGPSVARRHRR